MPPVTGIGSPGPVQPSSDAGHSAHTSSGSGTTSFAAALSQVMGRTPGTVLSGTPSPASSADGAQNSAHRDAWPSLGDGFQRRHIPLVGSGHPSHDFQQLALGLRAYRQQIIASNIANADTPGYKAVDIDFQEALRNAQAAANVPPVSLTTTSGGHLSGQSTGCARALFHCSCVRPVSGHCAGSSLISLKLPIRYRGFSIGSCIPRMTW